MSELITSNGEELLKYNNKQVYCKTCDNPVIIYLQRPICRKCNTGMSHFTPGFLYDIKHEEKE